VKGGPEGYGLIMSQPTPPEIHPAVPAHRTEDGRVSAGPETFSFVDIEHALLEEAELDAAVDAWDGFL
jgi:hypothetical protein